MNERSLRRGLVRRFAVAVAAIFALSLASQQRAEALSLASPGAVPAAKHATDDMATQVRHGGGGHGGGFHGGGFRGGGFHGGGFHGGGFHGGGFRGFHGGGYRGFHGGFHRHYGGYQRFYGGGHHYGYRQHFHHRRFYAPSYYDGGYYRHRHCRVIWTDYGPRRICRWHHRHHWRPYGYY